MHMRRPAVAPSRAPLSAIVPPPGLPPPPSCVHVQVVEWRLNTLPSNASLCPELAAAMAVAPNTLWLPYGTLPSFNSTADPASASASAPASASYESEETLEARTSARTSPSPSFAANASASRVFSVVKAAAAAAAAAAKQAAAAKAACDSPYYAAAESFLVDVSSWVKGGADITSAVGSSAELVRAEAFAENVELVLRYESGETQLSLRSLPDLASRTAAPIARAADDRVGFWELEWKELGSTFSAGGAISRLTLTLTLALTSPPPSPLPFSHTSHSVSLTFYPPHLSSRTTNKIVRVMQRWHLEEDISAAKRADGLRTPLRPITFHLDPLIPAQWWPSVKAGVERWRAAFEQAGWHDAIVALTPEDPRFPADYSAGDARYASITWAVSESQACACPCPCPCPCPWYKPMYRDPTTASRDGALIILTASGFAAAALGGCLLRGLTANAAAALNVLAASCLTLQVLHMHMCMHLHLHLQHLQHLQQ